MQKLSIRPHNKLAYKYKCILYTLYDLFFRTCNNRHLKKNEAVYIFVSSNFADKLMNKYCN